AQVLGRVDASQRRENDVLVSWIGTHARKEGSHEQALRVAWSNRQLERLTDLTLTTVPTGRTLGVPQLASQGETAIVVWTEVDQSKRSRVRGVRLREPIAGR